MELYEQSADDDRQILRAMVDVTLAAARSADDVEGYDSGFDTITGPTDVDGGSVNLHLRLAMDSRSNMMDMLSNLEKKYADTASQITQNLK
jgi:hypothetical protein